jgi:hypothetical protein
MKAVDAIESGNRSYRTGTMSISFTGMMTDITGV